MKKRKPTLTSKSKCVLTVRAKTDEVETFAASELKKYLGKTLGLRPSVRKESGTWELPMLHLGIGAFSVNPGDVEKASLLIRELKAEGFAVRSVERGLLFAGKDPKGLLNAVYTFLEKHCDIRFLEPGVEEIPRLKLVSMGNISMLEGPAFEHRGLHGATALEYDKPHVDWMAKNRMNVMRFEAHNWPKVRQGLLADIQKRGLAVYAGQHSAEFFLPKDKYFESHPEYFALVDGKRQSTQYCYSNKEAMETYTTNVLEFLKANPEVRIIGLWPSDGYGFCECEKCEKVPDGKLVLSAVNEVAKAVYAYDPDIVVEHLSYIHYTVPPKGIRPFKNVNVLYCPYWDRSKFHPVYDGRQGFGKKMLANDGNCRAIMRNIKGWLKRADNISIFSYYTDQIIKSGAYVPSNKTSEMDYRYYEILGLRGIHDCNCVRSAWWMDNMNEYAMARSLWNPHIDSDQCIKEFCAGYYGKASGPMLAYGDAMLAMLRAITYHGFNMEDFVICGEAAPFVSGFSPELDKPSRDMMRRMLKEAESHLDSAARIAARGPTALKRRISRLQLLAIHFRMKCEAHYQIAKLHHYFSSWEKGKKEKDRRAALHTIAEIQPLLSKWGEFWTGIANSGSKDFNLGIFQTRVGWAVRYFQTRKDALLKGGGKVEDEAFRETFEFDL